MATPFLGPMSDLYTWRVAQDARAKVKEHTIHKTNKPGGTLQPGKEQLVPRALSSHLVILSRIPHPQLLEMRLRSVLDDAHP